MPKDRKRHQKLSRPREKKGKKAGPAAPLPSRDFLVSWIDSDARTLPRILLLLIQHSQSVEHVDRVSSRGQGRVEQAACKGRDNARRDASKRKRDKPWATALSLSGCNFVAFTSAPRKPRFCCVLEEERFVSSTATARKERSLAEGRESESESERERERESVEHLSTSSLSFFSLFLSIRTCDSDSSATASRARASSSALARGRGGRRGGRRPGDIG